MIPNELRENDFSIRHSGGLQGIPKSQLGDTIKTNFAGIDIVT